MSDDENALELATEIFVDVLLPLAEGKDDDDLIFLDGVLRGIRDELGIAVEFDEIQPMTAGEFRRRWRAAKGRLAREPVSLGESE